jgi:hypothetical protein
MDVSMQETVPEAHPFVGITGATIFIVVGIVFIVAPEWVQQWALKSTVQMRGGRIPFVNFVESRLYGPAVRAFGVVSLLIGLMLLAASWIALRV